jgi:Flp pilus assembly protein TadB
MTGIEDLLLYFRDRVGPVTAISAIAAAGGMVIFFLGLTAVQRVSLDEEAARISGIREPGWSERLQMRLNQTGLRIRLWEFVAVGALVGGLAGALLMVLGFVTMGILAIPAGLFGYYQILMHRRSKTYLAFVEQLPDAIDDAVEYFAVYNDVVETVKALSQSGPSALRQDFAEAVSLIQRTGKTAASLAAIGAQRPETFWRQFMDALAHYDTEGGNLKEVLHRIGTAQRSQSRLHRKIVAQQAGGRLVGAIYAISPFAFLLFMRFAGGEDYARFYSGWSGQVAQIVIVLTGVVTWIFTNRIARRGLYLDDNPGAPALSDEVHRTGVPKQTLA